MLAAMRLEDPPRETEWYRTQQHMPIAERLDWTNQAALDEPDTTRFYPRNTYGQTLIGIVHDCLRFDPNLRPTAAQLHARVQQGMQGRQDGQRNYHPLRVPPNHPQRIVAPMKDPYKIGKRPQKPLR